MRSRRSCSRGAVCRRASRSCPSRTSEACVCPATSPRSSRAPDATAPPACRPPVGARTAASTAPTPVSRARACGGALRRPSPTRWSVCASSWASPSSSSSTPRSTPTRSTWRRSARSSVDGAAGPALALADVSFSCYLQPRVGDRDVFGLLRAAGCTSVDLGVDSAAEALLPGLGKSFTVADLRLATSAAKAAGLDVCHSLLFGGPGETPSTVDETVRVTDELAPTAVVAMVGLRIYPGTALAGLARSAGVIGEREPLLEPRFYAAGRLAGDPETAWLPRRVRDAAATRRSWFLPGARDWSAAWGPRLLRRLGKPGPLWRNFPRPRWYRYVARRPGIARRARRARSRAHALRQHARPPGPVRRAVLEGVRRRPLRHLHRLGQPRVLAGLGAAGPDDHGRPGRLHGPGVRRAYLGERRLPLRQLQVSLAASGYRRQARGDLRPQHPRRRLLGPVPLLHRRVLQLRASTICCSSTPSSSTRSTGRTAPESTRRPRRSPICTSSSTAPTRTT